MYLFQESGVDTPASKCEEVSENSLSEIPSWYAVSTLSRHERVVSQTLQGLGFNQYLPVINEERQWSDRKKKVILPLFPGYLFVQMARTVELQLSVRKVPGVVDFVRSQNGPLPVREEEIESVRRLLSGGAECSLCPFLKAGDRVRVFRGPLAGMVGIYQRCGSRSRIVVSVEIIQRSVSVDVAACDVEPVPNPQLLAGFAQNSAPRAELFAN